MVDVAVDGVGIPQRNDGAWLTTWLSLWSISLLNGYVAGNKQNNRETSQPSIQLEYFLLLELITPELGSSVI